MGGKIPDTAGQTMEGTKAGRVHKAAERMCLWHMTDLFQVSAVSFTICVTLGT